MEKSLKDGNRFSLYVIMVANWFDLLRNGGTAIPALGLILTGVLNAQLSAEMKSRIVFVLWRNPLPGCAAFSNHAKDDTRIDFAAIQRLYGPLPEDPRAQNAL